MRRIEYASVGALAGGALLLESAFTRLLAVAQFYHFAFLAISLALIGFGASGSILTVIERRSNQLASRLQCERILAFSGFGFAVSVAVGYGVLNLFPFDSFTIAWEPHQIGYFFLYYLAISLPFVFAGLGIGCALSTNRENSHQVYAANLIGSALGVLLSPLLLAAAGVLGAVLFSLGIGLVAALTSGIRFEKKLVWGVSAGIGLIVFGLIALNLANRAANFPLGMTLSPYKGLEQALRIPGARRIFGRWNAISRVDLISGASTHQLPGLSYAYTGTLPEQVGLSIDGDTLLAVGLVQPMGFGAADYLPEAVAFRLRPGGHALVLEPGGGLGVLQALAGGAGQVTVVIGNPLILTALSKSGDIGNIYNQPGVISEIEMPRVYLQRTRERYDIVFLPLTDGYRPVTNGAYSLSETYLLTVEAFAAMLDSLTPDGIMIVSRWLQTPPSEETRLIATLIEAMEQKGVIEPGQTLVAWRGINTLTAMVKPTGWSQSELEQVRSFLASRRFDLVWAPDITLNEVNQFNLLPEPAYYQAMLSLLDPKSRAAFYKESPYVITPSTDDRPFFFHFFKWRQTPALLAAFGHIWQPFGGSGFFVLLALLALVGVLSIVFIVIPLSIPRRGKILIESEPLSNRSVWRVLVYFASLGFGFLFVEIPLIQRWILFLGHPTYAFSAVVFVLLVFSSIGSLLARCWWAMRYRVMVGLVILVVITPVFTSLFTGIALTWTTPWRILVGAVSLAPLAILMGFPFPFGLIWLERWAPGLKAWAWAVNGCASVVAAVLAAILALTWGFQVVLLGGAIVYSIALLMFPGQWDKTYPAQISSH